MPKKVALNKLPAIAAVRLKLNNIALRKSVADKVS